MTFAAFCRAHRVTADARRELVCVLAALRVRRTIDACLEIPNA